MAIALERLEAATAKVKFKVTLLSPSMAKELLAKNHPNNRKVRDIKVNQIFRDIQAGNGKLTFDPIVIDVEGWMLNGQHRCHAVLLAEEGLPVIIMTNFPFDSIYASDQGAKRTVGDLARITGNPFPHGAAQYSAIARMMMAGVKPGKQYTHQEILEFIERHRPAIEFTFECMPCNKKFLTHSPLRAVIARAYYQADSRDRIKKFCEGLLSGLIENRQQDSAVITLRNWLTDNFATGVRSSAKPRPSRRMVYAKTSRALQAFIAKEPLQKIQETNKELFPL